VLSDPIKLLVMFDLLDGKGLGFDRLRYYTFLLKEEKGVKFNYRFYWTSGPFSRELEDDVNNLVAAELLEKASPLKISDFGKTVLNTLNLRLGYRLESFRKELRPYLEELQKCDLEELHKEAYICITSR